MIQPWFAHARFGLFIHRGLYAVPGTHEWHLHQTADYDSYLPLADKFNLGNFDPEQWADLAWNAGMHYVVFTTKHHDGFCMYDNPHTDFKITNAPFGRDITARSPMRLASMAIALVSTTASSTGITRITFLMVITHLARMIPSINGPAEICESMRNIFTIQSNI